MSQLPLIALGRVPFIKRNKVIGNGEFIGYVRDFTMADVTPVVFWVGLLAGFPLLCVAYCAY